jgi:peptidoglycan/LPS O-acetylase OafA/YrhL
MTERDPGIDWIRAICILYIVGFWHLLGYASAIPDHKNGLTSRLTLVVLALFLFVSAHLIRRSFENARLRAATPGSPPLSFRTQVVRFFRSRLLRIYPPYLLALLLFEACGLLRRGEFLDAALLVSAFTGNPPLTLWFITVLVVYVVLTPFLLLLRQRINPDSLGFRDAWILLAIYGLSHLLARHLDGPDPRLFFYMPAFAAGLLAPLRGTAGRTASGKEVFWVGFAFLGAMVLSIHSGDISESNVEQMPMALFGAWFAFHLVERGTDPRRALPGPVFLVAFASYFMYLLHRPVFWLLTHWGEPPGALGQLSYLLLICLPVTVLLSWLGQKGYGQLVRRMSQA